MFGSRGVWYQTGALISKNWLCSMRNREFISEVIMPIIAAVMISFKDNEYLSSVVSLFAPILIVVSANSTPRSLSIHLVEEKEGRYKETQKIMGLKQRAYVFGWIIYGYIKTMMSCLIFVIVWTVCASLASDKGFGLKEWFGNESTIPREDNGITPYKLISLYFIYASALLNQSLMFSTLFSTAKLAGEVITFLQVLTILFPYLVFVEKLQNPTYFILLSIMPQCGMSFIFESAMSEGVFSFAADAIARNYTINDALIQMSIESVVYLILYFYFDQIIPNEYGVSKSPLFFITDLFSKDNTSLQQSKVSDVEVNLINKQHNSDHQAVKMGDYSSAIYHQKVQKYDNKQSTVRIRNLTKRFGEFTAVDHLGINLYQSEILCLLGHNGAGKTTTISLLTGLLAKTSGEIIINDLNLEDNLDYIRQCVGICNQRDVLYNDLTVREQLVFMGRIKGLSGSDLDQEIAQIMKTTLLETESEKIISMLSGGNKRKLSLAMALIGGSVVIFLDEPTSGMDAMSRRVIWDILETVKRENRTIVLTTHHLDEAEHLADRIAIMAAGKLLACGSSEYIKNNFGEGYQLSIMVYNADRQSIVDLTLKLIPHSVLDPQSSQKSLLFLIPFKSKPYLLEYFRALESQFQNTIQVNFTINSLEDAFVNIGMDEEKFIQRARKQFKGSINNEQDQNEQDMRSQSISSEDGVFIEQQKVMKVPECLKRPPQFIFQQQLFAIYNRKYYTTVRSFSNYLAVIIPFALIITGILVCGSVDFGIVKDDDHYAELDDPVFQKSLDVALDKYIRQSLVGFFMLLSFCFNSSIYIYLPVLERETNLKYALTAMGCRQVPYWIGTFLFDYTLYLMFVIVTVLLSYIFSLDFLTDSMLVITSTFLSFGFSYCFYSYFIGVLIFKKASTAMKIFPVFNYFIAFTAVQLLYVIPSFLLWKGDQTDVDKFLIKFIDLICCMISPFYTFNKSFNNLTSQDQYVRDKSIIIPQISNNNYFCVGMMVFQGLMYFGLTLFFEKRRYDNIQPSTDQPHIDYQKANINDPAVFKEEEQMMAGQGQCPIRVTKLQKRYENGFLAIKNSSFGVHAQEIVGLLGPNGAGKSTSFNILTSLIGKTTGSVKILETEINRQQTEIFKETGICPQFDCIWENLTPVEHLYLFGRMKGLSGTDLEESVNYFIQTMQLDEYVKRKAGRLSGGNKRKLCVSNALIGGPSIQFFDEPSTGVDPIARRFLWQTLKQGVRLRQSSVVITTHTMDEAESLCDRIAIMINGEIYCIGSPQDLKNKYGQGYTIQIKGHTMDKQQLLKLMQGQFPTCKYIDEEDEHEYLSVYVNLDQFRLQLPNTISTEHLSYWNHNWLRVSSSKISVSIKPHWNQSFCNSVDYKESDDILQIILINLPIKKFCTLRTNVLMKQRPNVIDEKPQQLFASDFRNRQRVIRKAIQEQNRFDVLVLVFGLMETSNRSITRDFQEWYYGREFQDACLIFSPKRTLLIADERVFEELSYLNEMNGLKLYFVTKTSNSDSLSEQFKYAIKKKAPVIGLLSNDQQSGNCQKELERFIGNSKASVVDATQFVRNCLISQQNDKYSALDKNGKLNNHMMKKVFDCIENSIAAKENVTHIQIQKKIDKQIATQDEKEIIDRKFILGGLKWHLSKALVQSGGIYNIHALENDQNKLCADIIIVHIGVEFRGTTTFCTRTLMFQPDESTKALYQSIVNVHAFMMSMVKPKIQLSQIYLKAKEVWVNLLGKELEAYFPKEVGFVIGQNTYIDGQCQVSLSTEMSLCIRLYVEEILLTHPNYADQFKLSLAIADTVFPNFQEDNQVTRSEKKLLEVTINTSEKGLIREQFIKREPGHVLYQQLKKTKEMFSKAEISQREQHQQMLQQKKVFELNERLAGYQSRKEPVLKVEMRDLDCYQSKSVPQAEVGLMFIDREGLAIHVPVKMGHSIFHALTIKNVRHTGKQLHLIFWTPEFQVDSRKYPPIKDVVYIKELVIRGDPHRLFDYKNEIEQLREIARLQNIESQKTQVVEIIIEPFKRIDTLIVLTQVRLRPTLSPSARSVEGELQCHENGFRYQSVRNEVLEIPFVLIQHAFYVSPLNEVIAAIHFEFKKPLKYGTQYYNRIQFYKDIKGAIEQEAARKQQRFCQIDFQFDHEVEQLRNHFHDEYAKFLQLSSEYCKLVFEKPNKDLSFEGNIGKDRIVLQPTTSCLVNIVDHPFFVVQFCDVDIMCLERVQAGNLSFDIIIVLKELERNVMRVDNIEYADLEKVQEMMNACDVLYYTATQPLMWKNMQFSIQKDFPLFVYEGGWNKMMKDAMEHAPLQFNSDCSSLFEPESDHQQTSASEYQFQEGLINNLMHKQVELSESVSEIGDSQDFLSEQLFQTRKKVKREI